MIEGEKGKTFSGNFWHQASRIERSKYLGNLKPKYLSLFFKDLWARQSCDGDDIDVCRKGSFYRLN